MFHNLVHGFVSIGELIPSYLLYYKKIFNLSNQQFLFVLDYKIDQLA
jgi:hypothetical protein